MGCIYSDFHGHCRMWEEDEENVDCMGFDYDTGTCICEEDPDPAYSCESYESDGYDES